MKTYEPLSPADIAWLRQYVERNGEPYPGTRDARLWGRFLATLDAATAIETDRVLLEVSKVRQIVFGMQNKTPEEEVTWCFACDAIRDAVRKP